MPLSFRCLGLCASGALLLGLLAPAAAGPYALVADAGSTGTRVYVYHLDVDGQDEERRVQIEDVGKGPALSSFRDTPEKAADAVRAQIRKAQALIPEPFRASVPVFVYATAGMRLLPEGTQNAIYEGVRQGLLDESYPFDPERLEARTISGREEGVFALLAANYLEKTVRASLDATGRHLMGVLDLGGSSTQVAVPPSIADGESLAHKLGSEHTFVRSYLNLGMEKMRQRTYQRLVESALEGRAENPCAFSNYIEEGAGWRGSGRAAECQSALAEVIREEKALCAAAGAAECLGAAAAPLPPGHTDGARFFLISGYLYVTEFARWWLTGPHGPSESFQDPAVFEMPTVAELRQAAASLCAVPWANLTAAANSPTGRSRFTPPHKVAHRCFELNYIAALLSEAYGFPDSERLFRIVEEVGGSEIEWTLGAFLHGLSHDRSAAVTSEL